MVVASGSPIVPKSEKIKVVEVPMIDLCGERWEVSRLIVKASEEYGFFKVTNHGVSEEVIAALEDESLCFFGRPMEEKLMAGPPNPFGYGCKNIGLNGDMGEVEYLLLNTNVDPISIAQNAVFVSSHPAKLSSVVSDYIGAVRELGCAIVELMAEGLRIRDTSVWSRLIRDVDSDSVLRLNHYPPSSPEYCKGRIGFGEHTDPQILTLLRSNDVGGLQIYVEDGVWVPVTPDPTTFCVNVGDALQVMTNSRMKSVRHRVMSNASMEKSRLSMAYFCGPPLDATIGCIGEMLTPDNPCPLYRSFTWAHYKNTIYSLPLTQNRLQHFFKQ